ncbi:crossover junction endodeoxyribonuclease rusA, partial [Escherichia coli EC1736]
RSCSASIWWTSGGEDLPHNA